MTQQPPDQEPTPEPVQPPRPEHDPDHTAPLWYGQQEQRYASPEQTQRMQYSTNPSPQTPAESRPAAFAQPGAEPTQPAKPRRLAEIGAVAVLAAVLASSGTFALTRGDNEIATSPTAQALTSTTTAQAPVVQANPSAPDWSVIAAAVSPSVVAITVGSSNGGGGQGSGVILDAKGRILTNNHVVTAGGTGSQLSVTLNDKRTYDATIVGTDPSTDLAVITLTDAPNDLKPIALGDANALKVGDPVMAVGNPLGLAGTVTTGIVSALNRPVRTSPQAGDNTFGQQAAGEPVVTNAVQTSAAINPGNSGGALVNESGQLIGINSSIASVGSSGSSQGGNIGIGFAIPVNEAKAIAAQLISSGKAEHAYLGVSSKDDIVAQGSAKRAAAVLTDVANGTPADKAGLKVGDAVIGVDGDSVDGALSLVGQIRERTAGDKVSLKILRDGKPTDVTVTLTTRPTSDQ